MKIDPQETIDLHPSCTLQACLDAVDFLGEMTSATIASPDAWTVADEMPKILPQLNHPF